MQKADFDCRSRNGYPIISFEASDIAAITALAINKRLGPDPATFGGFIGYSEGVQMYSSGINGSGSVSQAVLSAILVINPLGRTS